MDKDVKGAAFVKTAPETGNPVTNFPEEPRFQLLPPFAAAPRRGARYLTCAGRQPAAIA